MRAVRVDHIAGVDFRVLFRQLLHEGLLGGEDGGDRHQHHQQLPGGEAPAHQHVPQPAGSAALVEDLDLVGREHGADGPDHSVRRGVLDHAVLRRDNGVAAGLIDAADHFPVIVQGEGGVDLVAVARGLVHAPDGLHVAELPQQGDAEARLFPQLLGIGQGLQLAAAALFVVRAGGRESVLHPARPPKTNIFFILSRNPPFAKSQDCATI